MKNVIPSRVLGLIVLPALVLLALACGGGGKSGGGGEGLLGNATPGQDLPLVRLLSHVPDRPDLRGQDLKYTNHARLREVVGMSLTERSSSSELADFRARILAVGFGSYFPPLIGLDPLLNPTETGVLEDWTASFGFNYTHVDQDIRIFSKDAGHQYQIARGRFDPAAADKAIEADQSFYRTLLKRITHGDQTIYSWGEDARQNTRNRTRTRPLGIGGNLWFSGKQVAVFGHFPDDLKHSVDAVQRKRGSLADIPEMRLVATKIDSFGAYQADVGASTTSLSDREIGGLVEKEYGKANVDAVRARLLKPFTHYGAGIQGLQGYLRLPNLCPRRRCPGDGERGPAQGVAQRRAQPQQGERRLDEDGDVQPDHP